ncbi:MAG: hypothetical protein ACT4O3_08085, partial [Elusimicrobiota bacterium]
MNADAQKNIGKAVQELMDKGRAGLVALEGAFDPIDIARFRAFPDQDAVRKAADYLLREHKISGPVHAAFTSPAKIPAIVGVDDRTRYEANVEAYRRSAGKMAGYKAKLAERESRLAGQKSAAFNPALLNFDRKVQAYQEGNIPFGDYIRHLSAAPPRRRGTEGETSAVLDFLKALDLESSLDFRQVESERARLIESLVQKLTKDQTSALTAQSLAYRTGRIPYADFYRYLQRLCRSGGVSLAHFPAMDAYVRYILRADAVDPEALFREIRGLEEAGYARLAKTQEEKRLVFESRRIHITGKLLNFSLTPEEWREYETSESQLRAAEAEGQGEAFDLSSFEAFYKEAQARDQAMTDNLIKAMRDHGTSAAVLVAGGFHSRGITHRLTSAGVAVVSFVPKMEKIDTAQGSAYLSVFTQEKTPLEKLFDGEKLFLAQHPLASSAQFSAGLLTAVLTKAQKAKALILDILRNAGPGGRLVEDFKLERLSPASALATVTFSDGKQTAYQVRLDPGGDIVQAGEVPTRTYPAGRFFYSMLHPKAFRLAQRSRGEWDKMNAWIEKKFAHYWEALKFIPLIALGHRYRQWVLNSMHTSIWERPEEIKERIEGLEHITRLARFWTLAGSLAFLVVGALIMGLHAWPILSLSNLQVFINTVLLIVFAASIIGHGQWNRPADRRGVLTAGKKGAQENIFSDPDVRPHPLDLVGMTDDEILQAAEAQGIPLGADMDNLESYRHNLKGLLPYYEDMVNNLIRDYPEYHYIFLGRDAELLSDAMAAVVQETTLEDRVTLIPISMELADNLPVDSADTHEFLGQFIDIPAAGNGTKKYVVVDTMRVGRGIAWMNQTVRHALGLPPLPPHENPNGKPLGGILMEAAPVEIPENDIPLPPYYPQFELERSGDRYSENDFRVPFWLDRHRRELGLNFTVAAVSQMMPRYTGHTNRLTPKSLRGRQLQFPTASGPIDVDGPLWPVELVRQSMPDRHFRVNWNAPVNRVAAIRIQAEVIRHFSRIRNPILKERGIKKNRRASDFEKVAGKAFPASSPFQGAWQTDDLFRPGMHVVDFGSGSRPSWSERMVRKHGIRYTGFDSTPDFQKAARSWVRGRERRLPRGMRFFVLDYLAPLPNNIEPADIVTLHSPNPGPDSPLTPEEYAAAAVKQMFNALKPGGVALVYARQDLKQWGDNLYAAIFEKTLRKTFGDANVVHSENPPEGYEHGSLDINIGLIEWVEPTKKIFFQVRKPYTELTSQGTTSPVTPHIAPSADSDTTGAGPASGPFLALSLLFNPEARWVKVLGTLGMFGEMAWALGAAGHFALAPLVAVLVVYGVLLHALLKTALDRRGRSPPADTTEDSAASPAFWPLFGKNLLRYAGLFSLYGLAAAPGHFWVIIPIGVQFLHDTAEIWPGLPSARSWTAVSRWFSERQAIDPLSGRPGLFPRGPEDRPVREPSAAEEDLEDIPVSGPASSVGRNDSTRSFSDGTDFHAETRAIGDYVNGVIRRFEREIAAAR